MGQGLKNISRRHQTFAEENQTKSSLSRGSECLEENFQTGRVTGQLEQSQNSDDAEKLENIRILDVRDILLQKKIRIETDCRDVINNIH